MGKKLCHFCTTVDRNVYHDGACPQKKKQEKEKQERSKTAQAETLISAVNKKLDEAQRIRFSKAEPLLNDLEDRAARSEARRSRAAQRR